MSSECPGKNAWPELVGEKGKKAAKIIKEENPYVVEVNVLPDGTPVIQDFRCDRVWVWVDCDEKVVRTPMVG
ncbi:Inhibitor of trypsin and hageman factor [Bienertia sinuspersici]